MNCKYQTYKSCVVYTNRYTICKTNLPNEY